MALLSGFDRLDSDADSFSDWLNKTNEMIDLMRDDVITANSTIANTEGDARLIGAFVANTFHVANTVYGGNLYANGDFNSANLEVATNTHFANTCDEVHIENDLRVSGNLIYTIADTNFTNLIPANNDTYSVGNTSKQWAEGYFVDLDVSANATILNLEVTGNTNIGDLTMNDLSVANLEVTGTANIQSLEVSGLTANGVALVGNETSVSVSTPTVIDTFSKSQSKGFKYIIHGVNEGDASSVFTLELMCGHNDTEMFFTRYGELTNNFNATLVPQIQGSAIQLLATCADADANNVHTFNILRIETR